MDNYELLGEIAYVKVSKRREKAMKTINDEGLIMPSTLANKISMSIHQVSNVLNTLKKHDLVLCVNEEAHKGRLYKLTDKGEMVLEYYDNYKELIKEVEE